MRLFILRHGQAEPYCADDTNRALVVRGIAQVQQTADWMLSQHWRATRVLASPYRRAQQTAQVLLDRTAWNLPIECESLLTPDSEPALTAAWLDSLPDGDYLLAAHMPLVSRLTDYLTAERRDFATAAVAIVIRNGDRWQLHDFFTPPQ